MEYRVCVLSFEYPPAIAGGLGTFVTNLESGLMKNGVDVSIFRPAHTTPSELKDHPIVDSFTIKYGRRSEKILVHKLEGKTGEKNIYLFSSEKESSKFNDKRIYWWKGIKTSIFARSFLEYFRRNLSDEKIILHANDWHSALACCLVKEEFKKTPFLYTIHLIHEGPTSGRKMFENILDEYKIKDFLSREKLEERRGRKDYKLKSVIPRRIWDKIFSEGFFWLEPFIVDYADKVNTVSHGFLRENIFPNFMPYKVDLEKFTYVFNGMPVDEMILQDLSMKRGAKKKMLVALGLDDGQVFLSLGRQNIGQKATDVLVKAIEIALESNGIDDTRFVIIAGEKNIDKDVKNLLLNLEEEYPKNVHVFTGWVEDIADYYNAADAFLLPSRYEPFGLTQIEAMTRGAVVIGSWTGGIRDVQIDYEGWVEDEYKHFKKPTGMLSQKGNPESLAACIIDMHDLIKNKPDEYKMLQENAIQRAKYFTIDRTVRGYLKLYEEIVNRNGN